MKVKVNAHYGFNGCDREFEFELQDNLTEDEIEEEVERVVMDYVEFDWRVKDGCG